MYVLYQFLSLVQLLIIARVIVSWVASPMSRNPVVQLIRSVTEPILAPIRSILPRTGMFDLSPMVALFAIYLLQNLIARAISG
ncbi:MAG TPA: YggT family protein [Longimicrobium sp.]|nr:YggT family protein [Longimicrobium sp.]